MANEAGDIRVITNGEIYNFRELRRELESLGHRFSTRCDTEVLVHGYEEWGEALPSRLRGMFAFAVVDERRAGELSLLIARDHFGIKPLYYAEAGGVLLFGSEMKSLLATGSVARDIDTTALDAYLSFLYVPEPRTIFREVRALPPGHLLVARNGKLETRRYWRFEPSPTRFASREEAVEATREAFEDSVRGMLVADVPVGLFLSAGMDSAAVLAIMSRYAERPIQTFTIGFGSKEHCWDEVEGARRLAKRFETEHHEFRVEPNIIELVPEVVSHFDQPFANPTAVILYMLARETRRHVKVVLAGTGGDELFGGYPRYLGMLGYEWYRLVPGWVRRSVAGWARSAIRDATDGRSSSQRLRRFLESGALPFDACYASLVMAADLERKRDLYTAAFAEATKQTDAASVIRNFFSNGGNGIEALMAADLETYLPFNQLAYADRMSMAQSLELRVPFVDQRLVDVAGGIPLRWKIRRGVTKALFRETMASALPKEVVEGPKLGLNLPIALWFRDGLSSWLGDLLSVERLEARGYFRSEVVRELIDEHASERRDHSLTLWALAVLELWHQRYLD
jgi:asparagine synthase (glutamine-hydrolysing)